MSETKKQAQTLNRLFEIAYGFVGTQALISGCELGIFEALAEGPRTLDELSEQSQLKSIACRRLLMALCSLELVQLENGEFHNTDLGQSCTSHADVNFSAATRMSPFDHLCEYLPDALRENSPRWQQALGVSSNDTFASLYANPDSLRAFADLMDGFSIPQGQLIAESYDFSSHECIMDVAGGPGGQGIHIGLKYPHLRGIITDLEPMCEVASERIKSNGLDQRFTAEPADLMTGPYPTEADVILLGHILHDWGDENCRKILNNCASALPTGGVLLISDSVLEEDFSGRNFANLKDMIMLVANESDARERSEKEFVALLDATGFDLIKVIRMEAPRDLLVAKKGIDKLTISPS